MCLWQEVVRVGTGCEIISFSGCIPEVATWLPRHCFDVGVKTPLHEHLQKFLYLSYFCAWQKLQWSCRACVATGSLLVPSSSSVQLPSWLKSLNFRGLRTALPDGHCHLCIMTKEPWFHQYDVIFEISLETT